MAAEVVFEGPGGNWTVSWETAALWAARAAATPSGTAPDWEKLKIIAIETEQRKK